MRTYNFQVFFLFEISLSFNKMSSKEVTEHMLGNEKSMNRFTLCNYLMRKLFKSARLSTNVRVT